MKRSTLVVGLALALAGLIAVQVSVNEAYSARAYFDENLSTQATAGEVSQGLIPFGEVDFTPLE